MMKRTKGMTQCIKDSAHDVELRTVHSRTSLRTAQCSLTSPVEQLQSVLECTRG